MNIPRIRTLVGKELREFRSNPAAVLPVVILVVVCVALPFVVLVVIPHVTGESLAADRTIRSVVALAALTQPHLAALPPGAAAEAFMFQQFLLLFLVAPIVGAVSLAAYSVVGEKQGRTLEPLLTTPITTAELLVAKVLASFLPSLVVEAAGLAAYIMLVAALGAEGVVGALLSTRSFVMVGLVGPLASLAALQMTIAISSRVNDPRSAQQIAVLLVLPLVVVLVGQVAGAFILTTPMLVLIAAGFAALWLVLIVVSASLFQREVILTRWK
ncbi:MAG: ABC transporter permease subunit [Acidobacteriota bacterium]|nr:ABC transporter permease subunit [Acidobacteriota bacterium]